MKDFDNGKDRLIGKLKETAGKLTDNEELEFRGKLQNIKSDIGERLEDMKEDVLEKTNSIIDKVRGDTKDN